MRSPFDRWTDAGDLVDAGQNCQKTLANELVQQGPEGIYTQGMENITRGGVQGRRLSLTAFGATISFTREQAVWLWETLGKLFCLPPTQPTPPPPFPTDLAAMNIIFTRRGIVYTLNTIARQNLTASFGEWDVPVVERYDMVLPNGLTFRFTKDGKLLPEASGRTR